VLTRLKARLARAADDRVAVRELRASVHAAAGNGAVLPADPVWDAYVRRLSERVMRDDPRRFLRWDLIGESMFVGNAPYVATELEYLRSSGDWDTRWKDALRESAVGSPERLPYFPESSGNLIHHAYHVARFEDATGTSVRDLDTIVELGAGYGSLCRLIFSLGFRGRYVILDLPQFAALQRYFLRAVGVPVGRFAPGVRWVSGVDELAATLGGAGSRRSLFVALWSLSETPFAVRHGIEPLLAAFNAFLIAYQDRFGGIDNAQYFRAWRRRDAEVRWHDWPIEHIPGNAYCVGIRP
jgi:hypothetical protein